MENYQICKINNHFSYFNKNIRKYMFMGNLNKSKQKIYILLPIYL